MTRVQDSPGSNFNNLAVEYDQWFERHPNLYMSELKALKKVVPAQLQGVEIGAGTGRFCIPFGINTGVEPSPEMGALAIERGIRIIRGVAEYLPLQDNSYDYVLMVTLDCFLKEMRRAFDEAKRVLRPNGKIVIGMIDGQSWLAKKYESSKTTSLFYKDAVFHTVSHITDLLTQSGFGNFEYWQTLITDDESRIEDPVPGFGEGGFVVVRGLVTD